SRGCQMRDKTSVRYGVGFRSLREETPEPVPLEVSGTLPSWLEGALLRTGPSKFEVGARTYNHWFDGLAMLHRFAFAQGRVSYTSRFLKSKSVLRRRSHRQDLLRRVRHRSLPHAVRPRRRAVQSQTHRQLLRQCLRLCAGDGRLHRDIDPHALPARDAEDAWRVRLSQGAQRPGLDGAPPL